MSLLSVSPCPVGHYRAHEPVSRIRQTVYPSDYDFQTDLSGVMISLNDGHHAWVSCYGSFFTTLHEFPIAALDVKGDGDIGIYLVPDLPTFARVIGLEDLYGRLGLNTTELAGARILSIDGQGAWDFLEGPDSKRVGTYQDPAQRLNVLLASYTATNGVFQRYPGDFTVTRDLSMDDITMVVEAADRQQKTISVPWITRWTQPWSYASGADLCVPTEQASGKTDFLLALRRTVWLRKTMADRETQLPRPRHRVPVRQLRLLR